MNRIELNDEREIQIKNKNVWHNVQNIKINYYSVVYKL